MAPRSLPPSPTADPAPGSLTPVAVQILLALADRDRHGLGIAEHIETFTNGRVSLGPGTLYGAIKRLLELGLVEDTASRPRGDHDDPRRRVLRHYAARPPGPRSRNARHGDRY